MQQVVAAFTAATGIVVNVTTTDRATFEIGITTYVKGQPDDVFTWFAGHELRQLADAAVGEGRTDGAGVWIDRHHRSLEAGLQKIARQDLAYRARPVARPDQGDGLRLEKGAEITCRHRGPH